VFTTRADGNLSTKSGEGHERGAIERARLREELGLGWLCAGPQVHGANVQRVCAVPRDPARALPIEADGRATALQGVGVMVLTADCLPVLIGSERSVVAVHAGWRGIAAGVLEEGVRALGGARASEIVAIIGPGAGPCCYEVGPEVRAACGGVQDREPNLDLPAIAHDRLLRAGVDRVEGVGVCTICDERFFSHRREASGAGRQAGIAWLR
jgi:YfiH family protein